MTQIPGDKPSQLLEEFSIRSRTTPKRRITLESVAWTVGLALVAYMLFAAVAGILYAG